MCKESLFIPFFSYFEQEKRNGEAKNSDERLSEVFFNIKHEYFKVFIFARA